jgi:hypothetical protein
MNTPLPVAPPSPISNPGASPVPAVWQPTGTAATGAAPRAPVDARTRNLALGLFGAALLILAGVVTRSWFTVGHRGHIGLTGLEACGGGHCETIAWSHVPHLAGDIAIFAWLGLLSGLAAVGVTVAMGGMLLAGKADRIPQRGFEIVLGIAAFSTTMFLFRLYGDQPRGLSFGWSGFAAIGGLVTVGILAKRGVAPRAARVSA